MGVNRLKIQPKMEPFFTNRSIQMGVGVNKTGQFWCSVFHSPLFEAL